MSRTFEGDFAHLLKAIREWAEIGNPMPAKNANEKLSWLFQQYGIVPDTPGVSNFAQTPDGQRRNPMTIDTPSQSVRSSIQLAEPEPVRVSVASLRSMSGERKYHAITFNPARRIADPSAARCSRRCRRNNVRRLLLGWMVARQCR